MGNQKPYDAIVVGSGAASGWATVEHALDFPLSALLAELSRALLNLAERGGATL